MSVSELERELARWRDPGTRNGPSTARQLSTADALAHRDAGNLPDEEGRSLRLVLHVDEAGEWRRPGSAPVNIVPLRVTELSPPATAAWFDQPELAALEREWRTTGAVGGLRIPAEVRGFVYKTLLSLRATGRAVTVDTVASSISRWTSPEDAERIRRALKDANPRA